MSWALIFEYTKAKKAVTQQINININRDIADLLLEADCFTADCFQLIDFGKVCE